MKWSRGGWFAGQAAGPRPGASLAGQLLVATREMSDPRFRQTVILMAQHNEDGALGVVINRPLQELPLAKLPVWLREKPSSNPVSE